MKIIAEVEVYQKIYKINKADYIVINNPKIIKNVNNMFNFLEKIIKKNKKKVKFTLKQRTDI